MNKKEFNKLTIECDEAIFSNNIEKINLILAKLKKLEDNNKNNSSIIAHILYCIGNIYKAKAELINERIDDYNNSPINNICALNYLRKAQMALNKNSYPYNPYEIRTNIANSLNSFCRVIEANHFWTFKYDFNALNDANYVAPYSKALTLIWLSKYLNEEGHAFYYQYEAYNLLNLLKENEEKILHCGIKEDINNNRNILDILKWGENNNKFIKSYKQLSYNIKFKSNFEEQYKRWCAQNVLFLNPMNDITSELFVTQDILQFPNYIVRVGEGPFYSSAFSDIKNRFCKARYILYCGLYKKYPKWIDDNLYLTDTLDYVDFSTNTEYIKIAFRLCFSILDSITSLMNQYFDIKDKKCSFNSLWIKNKLYCIKNPFIYALYWLSCDLTDINSSSEWNAPNPNASKLRILRNDLEHNWIRIAESNHSIWNKTHDYSIICSKEELKNYTLEIFRYTRSAILYLTFAVTYNEQQKNISHFLPVETPLYNIKNLIKEKY